MNRRLPLILLPLILAGCGGNPPSSSPEASSSPSSSEAASSAITSSGVSPTSSATSSETPSSEATSSAQGEKIITLFDAESRFFLSNTAINPCPVLKTYRHKYHGAVPYVDLEEFTPIFTTFDPDLKQRNYVVEPAGTYFVSRENGAGIRFDAAKQTATIVDGDNFYGDMGHLNNGIQGDVLCGIDIVKPSEKTRVLKACDPVTVPLGNYRLDIVSQDGHLYVPFAVANHFFMEPFFGSAAYSGRDFYQTKYLFKDYHLVRARSRKGHFSWNADPGDGGGTGAGNNVVVMAPQNTPDAEDAYTFKGKTDKGAEATLHLKTDGKVECDSRIISLMMLEGHWTKSGDFLDVRFEQLGGGDIQMEIDLGERTYYNVGTRDADLARYNYDALCLDFDYLYGLKAFRGIESFDAYFEKQGYKQKLLSTDTAVYDKALAKFLLYDIDDLHTSFVCSSFTGTGDYSPTAETGEEMFGPRDKAITEWRAKLGTLFSKATTEGKTDGSFTIRGSTAVIHYADYNFARKEEGYQKYTVPEGKTIQEAATAYFNESFFRGWAVCMNEILKHPEVKNIVFDISENRGGYVYDFPIFCAIMDDDPRVIQRNVQTGGVTEFHHAVDLNGDGVHGGEGDTFKGKYNFAVLTSPASFSAGNITPSLAKNNGFAKIIGMPSAGGPCPVTMRTDTFGFAYRTSAQIHYPLVTSDGYGSNDAGVPVDIALPAEDFFDVAKIDTILKEAFK